MTAFEKEVIHLAKKIAISSLIIGSLIFIIFLFFSIEGLVFLGVIFIFFAIISNGTILLQLTYLWIWKKRRHVALRNAIVLVLVNIPIALILMNIASTLYTQRFGF